MVANAFSRIPNDLVVESFSYALQSVVVPTWMHNGDPTTTELIEQLFVEDAAVPGYQLKTGILFYKDRMYVGISTSLRHKLLDSYYNSPIGGQSGIHVTYLKLKKYFFLAWYA